MIKIPATVYCGGDFCFWAQACEKCGRKTIGLRSLIAKVLGVPAQGSRRRQAFRYNLLPALRLRSVTGKRISTTILHAVLFLNVEPIIFPGAYLRQRL